MSDILLATLNARYIHSAFGLRYLKANMGELEGRTRIMEFTLERRPIDIVEQILATAPRIVGFGVYIWNIEQTTQVVAMLKRLAPQLTLVLGGPNISFEQEKQPISQFADYIITGQADLRFAQLCREILGGEAPRQKIIAAPPPRLDEIALPYHLYSDEDIAQRVIYVEASRGCPFKCEFCISALDKTARPFEAERFFTAMEQLHRRGVRHFKFVDRTFNLNVAASSAILEFFLQRMDDDLFLHFEVIPDRLPDKLKAILRRFPPGSLQLEIGVQTFNPAVQQLISRKQDDAKTEENLRWIRSQTQAHIHADLIAGLPGEDLSSFARGFDRLVALDPHEIQLGILKRLPGTPIIRHTEAYEMVYNPYPPYNILSTGAIDFQTMQAISRFARYWDMIANSGRFRASRPLLLADRPFERFMALSQALFERTGQTHQIALKRLFELVHQIGVETLGIDPAELGQTLWRDYQTAGLKGRPQFLQEGATPTGTRRPRPANIAARQGRHGG